LTKEDVLQHLEAKASEGLAPAAVQPQSQPIASSGVPATAVRPPAKPHPVDGTGLRERREPMSRIRKRIAERLVQAQHTAAILTTFNEIDMTAVMAMRAKYNESFKERFGVSLGLLSFFAKASVEALRAFPAINAEIRGDDIVYKDYYALGIAVATEQGLLVPVIRDVDRKSLAEIETELADLGQRARTGKINVEALTGGTFTISNGGVFGSLLSTPILNPPQSGILGLHKIEKRPMVAANDEIVVRSMMYVALSYDHRIVDGREAVLFLRRVKDCIEDPNRLLLGM
jgi:2-oxoglutarate dehydrogenase E2 component (dihydrolipoamide succinyltransferase)